jgi:hypothetical protein
MKECSSRHFSRYIDSIKQLDENTPNALESSLNFTHLGSSRLTQSKPEVKMPELDTDDLLRKLDVFEMLEAVVLFPTSDEVANSYEDGVNAILRKVQQATDPNKDLTLPLREIRTMSTVYFHLRFLLTTLSDHEEKSKWLKETEKYSEAWKQMMRTKDYPNNYLDLFREIGEIESDGMRDMIEGYIEAQTGNAPKWGLLKGFALSEAKAAWQHKDFDVYWHLQLLCDDLPEGEVKETWKSKQRGYLKSEKEQARAMAYANEVEAAIEDIFALERGMGFDEYYETCFQARKRPKRRAAREEVSRWLEEM